MNKKPSLSILSLTTLFVLVISAVFTAPVFADSGTTPPAPPPSGGLTRAPHSSSNNLSNMPAGTKVVVVDSQGDKVALGSQQAQDILNSGDPIWCPSTVTIPISGASGCTSLYIYNPPSTPDALTGLLSYLQAHQPTVAGTIWIEMSYDSAISDPDETGFTLNGLSTYSTMSNYALTIKGGWYGSGSGSVYTTLPSTQFEVPISITNWNAPVTISDIKITGASSGTAVLTVSSSQGVTLTRVQSINSASGNGAKITSTGAGTAVSITSSQFSGNAGGGLDVLTAGPITLTSVTADGNLGGVGANLQNLSLSTPYTVTVNGASDFSGNSTDGLDISVNGKIAITDLTASNNISGYGTVLNNCYVSLPGSGSCAYTSAQPVSMTGMNIFLGNYDGGLQVISNGAITAKAVIANSNQNGYGASFDNSGAASAQAVSLTGTNNFKYNGLDGLDITSKGGITVNSVTANSNGQAGASGTYYGADLNNTFASPTAPGTVKTTGSNYFYDNYTDGLYVTSLGAVTLNSVTANNNQFGAGLVVNNDNHLVSTKPQSVSLTGTNIFDSNDTDGLDITSAGVVTLANVNANNNPNGQGANINNAIAATSAQSVSLTGTNGFSNNFSYGLTITSYGNISLAAVTANGNGSGDNTDGVKLTNTNLGAAKAVSIKLTGVNTFNGNQNNGLTIETYGAVSASNLTANNNDTEGLGSDGYGVFIDNCAWNGIKCTANPFGIQSVALSGVSQFIGDYSDDLHITTNGAITLSGVHASQSQTGYGAYLYNIPNGSGAAQTVKISGTNVFDSNELDGLNVLSKGAISVSSVTAQNNATGNGITLDNTAALFSAPQNVTVSGVNLFTGNENSGLAVNSFGTVSLSSVTSTENLTDYGALIQGNGTFYPKAVTVTGTNVFSDNYAGGLSITSQGAVSLSNVTASGNTSATATGVVINTTQLGSTGGVTLSGTNTFSSNLLDGLDITSNGAITLNTINANNNGATSGTGVSITDAGLNKVVKLTGTNNFSGNAADGLDINAEGAISANNITAINNGLSGPSYGASLDNHSGTGGVTLTGINIFTDNTLDGLKILSIGSINLTKVTADGNNGNGLTATTSGTSTITLTCGSFTDNTAYGLDLTAGTGAITLKGVVYSGNSPDRNNTSVPPTPGAWVIVRSCPLP